MPGKDEMPESHRGDSRPVPDPTELTRQALREAREFTISEVGHSRDLLNQSIQALKDVTNEKFRAIYETRSLTDARRIEEKRDAKTAVDAALAAREDAQAKAEAAITDQLQKIQERFDTEVKAILRELGGVKEQVGSVVQQKVGAAEGKAGLFAAVGIFITLVLAVLTIIGITSGGP